MVILVNSPMGRSYSLMGLQKDQSLHSSVIQGFLLEVTECPGAYHNSGHCNHKMYSALQVL